MTNLLLTLSDNDGNILSEIPFSEAHKRLSAFFTPEGSGSYGWSEQQATEALKALFPEGEQ